MTALIAGVFGPAGTEVHVSLAGGEQHRGEFQDVIIADGFTPLAIRIRRADGTVTLIPWHAIRSYAVQHQSIPFNPSPSTHGSNR